MADLIETAGCDRILTMDLHSPQVQGFFRIPADQMTALPLLADHLRGSVDRDSCVIVASDAGGSKDAAEYADRLDLPFAVVDKRRLGDEEKVKAVGLIGSVEGRRAFIVDDEVASGGTIVEAARLVISQGALSVQVLAVHPVLSGRAVERLNESSIESFVFTDTVPPPDQAQLRDSTFLSVAPLLARAVKAVHQGSSVSALFR